MLELLFCERDRAHIVEIHLSHRCWDDTYFWFPEPKGFYFVRLAYFLQCQSFNSQNSECCNVWKKLWALNVPPKWKHTVWRSMFRCLPVAANLERKGINLRETCQACENYPESIFHCFVECVLARECQNKVGVNVSVTSVDMTDWIDKVLAINSFNDGGKIVVVLWGLWVNRNNVVWRGKCGTVVGVVSMRCRMLEEWIKVRRLEHLDRSGEARNVDVNEN